MSSPGHRGGWPWKLEPKPEMEGRGYQPELSRQLKVGEHSAYFQLVTPFFLSDFRNFRRSSRTNNEPEYQP